MDGLFHGQSQSKMDDDWGYLYDSGNHHISQIRNVGFYATIIPAKSELVIIDPEIMPLGSSQSCRNNPTESNLQSPCEPEIQWCTAPWWRPCSQGYSIRIPTLTWLGFTAWSSSRKWPGEPPLWFPHVASKQDLYRGRDFPTWHAASRRAGGFPRLTRWSLEAQAELPAKDGRSEITEALFQHTKADDLSGHVLRTWPRCSHACGSALFVAKL